MAAQARAGRRAIMIKASDGDSTAGATRHKERATQAHRLGMRVLHYAFAETGINAIAAAAALRAAVRPVWVRGDRLVIDVEAAGGFIAPTTAIDYLHQMQRNLTAHGAPMAWGYADEALLAAGGAELADCCPFWIIAAWDGGLLGRDTPKLPRGSKSRLAAKQYTDGQVGAEPRNSPGIGACDCSILTSSAIKLLGIPAPAKLRRPVRSKLPRIGCS